MYLIITIDTEEDNWRDYTARVHTFENIGRIPYLQDVFSEFNVKPTYLITYPVATDNKAVSTLKQILDDGACEIGSHCHPWNTPPFEGENTPRNSMLNNLPSELQYRKMYALHRAIKENFGVEPISFRAGRFGFDQEVAKNLYRLGYQIDTSVTPFINWRDDGGPDFSEMSPRPFRFSVDNVFRSSSNGRMAEIPVTVGFLQENFALCNRVLKILVRRPINKLRLAGILYKLNYLNKVWLSPEQSDSKIMIGLTRCMMKRNYSLINMIFHSPSLKAGLSPFVKTRDDEKEFFRRIRDFLVFTRDAGIQPVRLCDVRGLL